jgi:bifunctional UDP-N-acetylglucosamine pyrophosphorylase/glucosamine-1-phosphate N-acetyltransferase
VYIIKGVMANENIRAKIKIVVLAGGKGKRMESEKPKALTEVQGKSILSHLLDSITGAHQEKPIAVVGHKAEEIKKELGTSFVYVIQEEQLGTAHALLAAKEQLKDAVHIIVINGDMPFIKSETIKNIIDKHLISGAVLTFATTEVPNYDDWYKIFWTFGRVIRKERKVVSIRELKDAKEKEKKIREVNAGCYIFDAEWLWVNLEKINNENAQKEYYLTDLIPIALKQEDKVESILIAPREALGVNSKEELEIVKKML